MKLFAVLRKDLQILLRNRSEMLVLFLMPLAFIIPISLALGSGDGYGLSRDNQMILLPVVDNDHGPHAQQLLTSIGESLRLEKDYGPELIQQLGLAEDPICASNETNNLVDNPACIEQAGRAMLNKSWRSTMLVIPEGFSKSIDAGETVNVQLIYDPAGDATRMQQVEGVVKGATIKLSLQNQVGNELTQLNDLTAFAPPAMRQAINEQTSTPQPASQQKPALSLVKSAPSNFQARVEPDTYQQTIPGYTVMYVFFIITSLTSSIHAERLNGTFRRLLSTPASRAELLGGKLLATGLVGLAQVLILFGVGALLFKLNLGSDPLAFLLLSVALVTVAATLGLAASTLAIHGGALAAPLVIGALLGGCMFPLDLMPSFLRTLSYLVPQSWALNGYQNLMVRGQGLAGVFPQVVILFAFALLFFLFAVRRFDFESQEVS